MAIQKERRATPRKPGANPEPEKRAVKPKAPAQPAAAGQPAGNSATPPIGGSPMDASPDEIRKLIEETAYFKAQRRGFEPGYELEDWVQAEAEVKQRLNAP